MHEIFFRILIFLRNGLLALLTITILYLAVAIACSAIPVNTTQPEAGDITIYLRSNGMHTDFIFPIENEVFDWKDYTRPEHTLSKRSDFKYVSFGWGDLEFYEHTPEWSDVRFPVAFQAVFLRKQSALHVEFLPALNFERPIIPVEITKEQYRELSDFVRQSFQKDLSGNVTPVKELHYNLNDVFYLANRSLNLFYTCNTWVNDGLKKSGLRASLWTPFDEGIFYQNR